MLSPMITKKTIQKQQWSTEEKWFPTIQQDAYTTWLHWGEVVSDWTAGCLHHWATLRRSGFQPTSRMLTPLGYTEEKWFPTEQQDAYTTGLHWRKVVSDRTARCLHHWATLREELVWWLGLLKPTVNRRRCCHLNPLPISQTFTPLIPDLWHYIQEHCNGSENIFRLNKFTLLFLY